MFVDQLTDKKAMEFVGKVEEPFKSLPHLPKSIVELFVKLAPWFALLGAILGLLSGPIIGFLGGIASLFSLAPTVLIWTIVSVALTLANSILLFMAFNPLKNREMKGWMLLFWCNVIGIVEGVLSLIWAGGSSFVGTVLSIVIGMYVLFEMKPMYDGVMGEVVKSAKSKKK